MALNQAMIDRLEQSEEKLRDFLQARDSEIEHASYIPENPYGVLEYMAAAHAHAVIAKIIIDREMN